MRLSRAKPRGGRIALPTRSVHIVVAAEPDNARPPHDRLFAGHLTHDGQHPFGVSSSDGVVHGCDELFGVDVGWLHLILGFGHGAPSTQSFSPVYSDELGLMHFRHVLYYEQQRVAARVVDRLQLAFTTTSDDNFSQHKAVTILTFNIRQ